MPTPPSLQREGDRLVLVDAMVVCYSSVNRVSGVGIKENRRAKSYDAAIKCDYRKPLPVHDACRGEKEKFANFVIRCMYVMEIQEGRNLVEV